MKPGYKRTDVGVIPADWEIVPLGQLLRRPPSYGINAPAVSFDFRFPMYLRITDITEDGKFSEETQASVDHSAAELYRLESGDIVFARTGASVGKSYLYNSKDGRLIYAGFLIRLSPDPERLVPTFLSFYAQSRSYWNWVKVNSMRSGQPGINGREYATLPIPLPPTLSEQETITKALNDADALIESLEQLLTKKRQIKKGTMQELLTGKKRLPGLSGEWKLNRLAQVADVHRKNVVPALSGDTLFMHFSLPAFDGGRRPVMEFGEEIGSNKFSVPESAVLVSKLNPRISRVWAPIYVGSNAVASTEFLVLTPRDRISRIFLYFLCLSPRFCEQMRLLTSGTTGSHQRISPPEVMNIEVWYPENLVEQRAIATILSDMDEEIAALEAKLSKARQLKQGMMQELLTGRIRLL